MEKKLVIPALLILGAAVPLVVSAQLVPDYPADGLNTQFYRQSFHAPHNDVYSCGDCHADNGSNDNAFVCENCHSNDSGGNYSTFSAPAMGVHSASALESDPSGPLSRGCGACHTGSGYPWGGNGHRHQVNFDNPISTPALVEGALSGYLWTPNNPPNGLFAVPSSDPSDPVGTYIIADLYPPPATQQYAFDGSFDGCKVLPTGEIVNPDGSTYLWNKVRLDIPWFTYMHKLALNDDTTYPVTNRPGNWFAVDPATGVVYDQVNYHLDESAGKIIRNDTNRPIDETLYTTETLTINDPAWSDISQWANKTGPERGLILHYMTPNPEPMPVGNPANPVLIKRSIYENIITDAWNNVDGTSSIAVRGASNIYGTYPWLYKNPSTEIKGEFRIYYGQSVTSSLKVDMTTGERKEVVFLSRQDAANNDGLGDLGSDSTPNGICQVCHTQTNYWRADGTGTEHNTGRDCLGCHDHGDGFKANCSACHGNPPTVDAVQDGDGMVATPSPTGSVTSGAHALHATTSGYNFKCESCHVNGMPTTPIRNNNKIQIGFQFNPEGTASYDGQSLTEPYAYEGTNSTSVTTSGTLACSNIYCHSNGGYISNKRLTANTSPSWNTVGPLSCDSCHPYPMSYGAGDSRKDTHGRHAQAGYGSCNICHNDTTTDGVTISGQTKHVNMVYDVSPAPIFSARGGDEVLDFTYVFAPNGGTCSSNSCHEYWGYSDPARWGMNTDLKVIPHVSGLTSMDTDLVVTLDGSRSACYELVNGVAESRTCSYEWDFGGSGTIIGGNGADVIVYRYDAAGDYTTSLTMTESTTGKVVKNSIIVTAEIVEPPALTTDFSTLVDGGTVTLTANLPTDVNIVRIHVYWGDRQHTLFTDPANDLMQHKYIRTDMEYLIRVKTIDSNYNQLNYTSENDPDLVVSPHSGWCDDGISPCSSNGDCQPVSLPGTDGQCYPRDTSIVDSGLCSDLLSPCTKGTLGCEAFAGEIVWEDRLCYHPVPAESPGLCSNLTVDLEGPPPVFFASGCSTDADCQVPNTGFCIQIEE